MEDILTARIQSAVSQWARRVHRTDEIVVGLAAEDEGDYDEAGVRYLVDYAVRDIGYWLVAEVWLENGQILSVNDLGEGLPLDNTDWPWPGEEAH